MINKGCIYPLVWVTDIDVEAPTLESVPVVNEFLEVFPDELHVIPPGREIDFGIDVMPDTQPISIPPYRMTSPELKELKEQLKDLLEKGFIRPSVSPWGTPVLFVRKKDGEGIKVDPQKIAAVKNWPRPTTPAEICSFLGLVGYYRKFVDGFSTLASPLTKLTQKTVKFQCLTHLEAYQRSLAREVHQLASLGVRLANSSEGGVIVQNRATSSLVVEVKEKQYDDPLLFGKKEKLSPRYAGPYRIIHRIGQVAYRLELPPEMSLVHPVFHVSMLKKVVRDPLLIILVETIEVNEELTYEEIPVAILDRQVRMLGNKEIASVKVLWRNQQVEEATWEAEEEMMRKYPHLYE
ncbi:uncharacterized protein [Nicotiana tomentosiformis]|uniref:uncharacterized protein n=1 Tax=Nicotiana tomentosiformis TaxID=4098 RepID=UPI00388C7F10